VQDGAFLGGERYGAEVAGTVKIQYGGSVTLPHRRADGAADIDGALVGGASLDPDKFAQIVRLGR